MLTDREVPERFHPDTTPALVAGLVVLMCCAPGELDAQVSVPSGFSVEPWAEATPQVITAIVDSAYGSGVIGASAEGGTLCVWRFPESGRTDTLAVVNLPEARRVLSARFAPSDVYNGELILAVIKTGDPKTYVMSVGSGGSVAERVQIDEPGGYRVNARLETSAGVCGYQPGAYLYDCDSNGGQQFTHMDSEFALHVVDPDAIPAGRTDLDLWDMAFDPTGSWGGQLVVADCDDTDGLSALYSVSSSGAWAELTSPVSYLERCFKGLAFSAGGEFGDTLYVADGVGEAILTVGDSGAVDVFSSGFEAVACVAISADGSDMWISDDNGIHHVFSYATDVPGEAPLPDGHATLVMTGPNPTSERLSYAVVLTEATRVYVSLYGVGGRLVSPLTDAHLTKGRHDFEFALGDGGGVPIVSGVYFIRLQTLGGSVARKLVVLR